MAWVLVDVIHNEGGLATARLGCSVFTLTARTEGGRDANYRMRFTCSPADVGNAGHYERRGREQDSATRRQPGARVLFWPSAAGACGDRSYRIDAVVCESPGRARNRMFSGSSG